MTAAPVLGTELFTEVHDQHFAAVYRYVAGRLGAQVAEDVAAETFLVAFDRRKTFDATRGDLRAWLFGIATNLVSRHRRKEARHYRALARLETPRPAEGHENRVLDAGRLGKALSRLSSGERDVLLLVALADLGYAEVAQALGISPGTVGSRLTRARKKLTPVLAQEARDE
ncbi:RNA polymerase sigma factor [Amycolatopsis sp. WQ 127309]|uniref:RNA polymerase sigma factor n=1 Tax=Amycolatopsis sp. WQ 127309 TaxID=2932773 RepID=UPI001FF553A1|nr:sigma-70 family RNA polymerase sigma factor [Amycolatopsis sp. WQ 127309]UOZ09071.1 sigma-70 family RNA polymerase sigma factor [Amycolatopsis sp. WQ 127309]